MDDHGGPLASPHLASPARPFRHTPSSRRRKQLHVGLQWKESLESNKNKNKFNQLSLVFRVTGKTLKLFHLNSRGLFCSPSTSPSSPSRPLVPTSTAGSSAALPPRSRFFFPTERLRVPINEKQRWDILQMTEVFCQGLIYEPRVVSHMNNNFLASSTAHLLRSWL